MEWIERAVDFGTPLIVLVLFLRMLARCAHWTAKHFILPLRDAWIRHLSVLDEHMEQQTRMLCEILERVEPCHAES